MTKARTIVEKIEDDLAYRLPTSGKPIPVITLSREQAEQLCRRSPSCGRQTTDDEAMRVAGPERRRLSWDGPGVNVPLATGPAAHSQKGQVRMLP